MSSAYIDPPRAGDILIVDDTAANVELLQGIPEDAGYEARQAANGELALHSAQARPPALILLDIRMPGMDGFEVCRRLKDNALTRDIPVIFLSALSEKDDVLRGFDLGAVDYIAKPFHNKEVLARARIHLGLSAAQGQLTNQIHQLQQTKEQLARELAEHERIQENLEAALKRLQTLNVRITAGQEEERHRIAYDLHEQLAQEIVSLRMYLGLLKSQGLGDKAQARLLVAQDIAKVMLERIRNLSRNLRAPELDTLNTLGLFEALQLDCRQQADAAGWVLHFDVPQQERPPHEVELACFRIVQDALEHISRHAHATEVWLSVRTGADALQLSLRDNGSGFNAAAMSASADERSLALLGMQERARQAGGSLEIRTNAAGGTELLGVFPSSAPSDRQQA